MNKTAIKNFAVWARNKLISDIKYRAGLMGITAEGIDRPLPQSTGTTQFFNIGTIEPYAINGAAIEQRRRLVEVIEAKAKDSKYDIAYNSIMEEVAYTWFNRLIAIRFMEVNDYLPSHVRVLSSESGKAEPDLVTNPFDSELEFTSDEKKLIFNYQHNNNIDELFCHLFIKQCNALNDILPGLFEKTSDYTELLLNLSVVDRDGVVYRLINDIPEKDFDITKGGQVEIIGWLYQYYISEKHEEVIDPLHGKNIKKEDIPAATQIFTTDWVVKYIIDNSLGKFWIERNPGSKLSDKLDFLVIPKSGEIEYVNQNVSPEELKVLDPCMGSGHFLVYAFEVLMEIYKECGYSDRDAAKLIVEKNIYGLDIDNRASQLAYFAVLMKARQYNRRILRSDTVVNVSDVRESNTFSIDNLSLFADNKELAKKLLYEFKDAKIYGTILQLSITLEEIAKLKAEVEQILNNNYDTLFDLMKQQNIENEFLPMLKQAEIMVQKYQVVATNPPYLNKYESKLKDYLNAYYKSFSGDLFSVFMYRNFLYCTKDGYSGFMTPNVWMFIQTYERLRKFIINEKSISSLIQLAKGSFFSEATVDVCVFVLQNIKGNKGDYFRLENFKGNMEIQKTKFLEAIHNNFSYRFETESTNFNYIPGSPIAYWVSHSVFDAFKKAEKYVSDYAFGEGKNVTTNNAKYILCYWEVNKNKIGAFNYHWLPCATGGDFRKWYGNVINVIDWSETARNFYKTNLAGRIIKETYWDMIGITWGKISSAEPSFRLLPKNEMYQETAILQYSISDTKIILSLLNSKVATMFLEFLAPTVNFQLQDICSIPLPNSITKYADLICSLVDKNINLSKEDWDSFEISMDFNMHPLITYFTKTNEGNTTSGSLIETAYNNWKLVCNERFKGIQANEEELNRIYIELYGLEDELTPCVNEKGVSIRKADLQRDIKSLISYAVGCMFGRYSLNCEGLAYAGGEWNSNNYSTYLPDEDNCIPITDEEYFHDDIVGMFVAFVKTVYGEDTLEDNLNFIASALGIRGNTSREVIRNYFVNNFFDDHLKTYQKRPIYWLFDSGKNNGFKALVYLHRIDADTIGNLRVDYLHKLERAYESEMSRMQDTIDNSTIAREVSAATKRKEKLTKQLKECRDYDEKIGHLALSRIELDLDDGVKVNYRKLQTANDGKFYEVLAKSKDIMPKEKK